MHWRGSRGNTLPGSGRYDDSQLAADMWLDRHGDRSVTEDSEGEGYQILSNVPLFDET